jgi:hypothetical protein
MEDKQKVTLYLSPQLHRQLKIRAAVDVAPMSELAQKAIEFYLNHSEVVEGTVAQQGRTYQVHSCPECQHPFVIKDGEAIALGGQPGIVGDEIVPELNREVSLTSQQPAMSI